MSKVYDLLNVENGNAFVIRDPVTKQPMKVHNCSQAMATQVMDDALHKINEQIMREQLDATFVGQVHDELLFTVSEQDAARVAEIIQHCMTQAPSWWPNIVLGCEGGDGAGILEHETGTRGRQRYGFAK